MLPFTFLCLCILAQAYSLPVLTVGPSWAVWPTPPVITACGMIGIAVLASPGAWPPLRKMIGGYVLLFALCLLSVALVTVAAHDLLIPDATLDFGFPLYHVWIMGLAGGSLWAASTIHIRPDRFPLLANVTLAALLWICVSIVLTYKNFIPTRELAPQLPMDPGVSGAFSRYLLNMEGAGLGTVGYNHAYPAAVVLILSALWLQLLPRGRRPLLRALVLSLGLVAVFLTGSRAGFAGFLLFFAAVAAAERSIRTLFGIVALGLLLALAVAALEVPIEETMQRQAAVFEAPSAEALAGRDVIWQHRLQFLNDDKVRWLIGTGFGSAMATGSDAHMLYLHIVVEMGVLGLLAFIVFYASILHALWRRLPYSRYFFLATACLLVSSLTQETLYPVPALGFTLPLYLIALAVTIRSSDEARLRAVRPSPRARPTSAASG
ncbi:MAG TPA: O-antigen ligase family protein [Gammaproteobacteria bacterium]